MKTTHISHLVKSEDLNHHGTLFAGRMAEWFVEACFISVVTLTRKPESIVCLKLHGLEFRHPATKGDVITIECRIVKVGRTSLTVHGSVVRNGEGETLAEGFATFVNVDSSGKSLPHGIELDNADSELELNLRQRAANLR